MQVSATGKVIRREGGCRRVLADAVRAMHLRTHLGDGMMEGEANHGRDSAEH